MGRPSKPQWFTPGPGRPGYWRSRVDGKYHYLKGVGRHEKPLAGKGPDAIPVKAWDWLNSLKAARADVGPDPTVHWVCLQYLQWVEGEAAAGRMTAAHWRNLRSALKLFWGFPGVGACRASAFSADRLAAFFESLRAQVSPSYVSSVGRAIRAAFRWAAAPVPGRVPSRMIVANPLDGYRFPRAYRTRGYVDGATVRRFYRWCWARARKAPGRSRRFDRLYVLMLWFQRLTGCRPGEACALRWDHWDRPAGKIVLTEHKTAKKTGRPRVIWVTGPVARLLLAIERLPGRHADHVFTHSRRRGAVNRGHLSTEAGEPWPDGSAASARFRLLRTEAIAAGVEGLAAVPAASFVSYMNRHAYASDSVNRGLSIEHAAELLGNSAAVMGTVYLHSVEQGARARAEAMARRGKA